MSGSTGTIGYVCSCGHQNYYDAYCYAHWHHTLTGPCSDCGRNAKVRTGRAWPARLRKGETSHDYFKPITKPPIAKPCSKNSQCRPKSRHPASPRISRAKKRPTSPSA